ncbi:hypothetical protein K523DRAFT_362326 [Schizophyllum commune Tattone D]|nr:hypothetical protein K523DRAFT_362326 [Schizophyllum commune Tattone D]
MKLLHVCSRWRSIALNAPLLWTNMSLLLRQVSSPEHIPHIIEWFRRAQPLAVDVHVQSRWHPEFRLGPRPEDSIVRGLLAPSGYSVSPTSQIRELDVFADPRDFVNITHGLPDDAFAQLRRLDIQCDYNNIVVDQLVDQPIQAFKNCPQLSHVDLAGLWCLTREPLSFLLPLPWSQLTFLRLRRCDQTHRVLDVLTQCTSLQHADLEGTIHHHGAEPSDAVRVIDHRSLASLEVTTATDEWPADLFRVFRYPMLHELTLAFHTWGYAWGRGTEWDLVRLAAPRFTVLSKFTLHANIMNLLVALPPTLQFIRFDHCLLRTELFGRFRVNNDNACLPCLTTLVFSNINLAAASVVDGQVEEELCRMVESRVCSDKVEHLRIFEVTFSPSEKWVLCPSACERLRSLEGLEDPFVPIHSLPPELLVEIFRYHTVDAISSVMKLLHVCSRWRTIALNAPELWTRLSLLRRQASSPEHKLHVVDWFRRAQSLAVDFYVQDLAHPAFADRRITSEDLSMVVVPGLLKGSIGGPKDVRPASQIRELSIYGIPDDVVNITDGLPDDAFPQLQFLHISCGYASGVLDGGVIQPVNQPIISFKKCPQLLEVTLQALSLLTTEPLLSFLPLPWSQIILLRLERCLLDHMVLDVLKRCSKLRFAILSGTIDHDEGLFDTASNTPLPFLVYLEVSINEHKWPANLFRAFQYPAVERLTLDFLGAQTRWAWGIEREDLLQAAPQFSALWKVTLRRADTRLAEDDIMAFFAALPGLRFVRFDRCLIWAALFACLQVDDSVTPILPSLTELVFIDTYLDEPPQAGEMDAEEQMCRMAESRVHSERVERLRAFEFSYEGEHMLTPDTSRRLRSLEGLEVRLPKDAHDVESKP